jgi:chromosome segregation ATPase
MSAVFADVDNATSDFQGVGKSVLQVEHESLRAALAAARGTVLDLRSHLSDLRAAHEFLRLSREATLAQVEARRTQAAALEAELSAVRAERDALLTEREWLRSVRVAHEARLQHLELVARQAEALLAERNELAHRAALLDRLVRDLRWEEGPRSIRLVLPLARLARRIRGR